MIKPVVNDEIRHTRHLSPLRVLLFRLFFVPMVGISLILIGMTVYHASTLLDEIRHEQQTRINSLTQITDQYIDDTSNLIHTLGHMFSSDNEGVHRTEMLKNIREDYPRFTTVYFLDRNGKIVLENGSMVNMLGLDLSGEPFYKAVINTKDSYVSETFISLETGLLTITAATPVISDGQMIGILVGELDLAYLQKVIETVNLKPGTQSFIVDRVGNIIAHPNTIWVEEQRNLGSLPIVRKSQLAFTTSSFYYDENQQTYVIGSASISDQGWIIVTSQPLSQAMGPLIVLGGISLLLAFLSAAILHWVQTYSRHIISEPLAHLARYTDQLAEGDYPLEQTLPDFQIEELHRLGKSFFAMAEAVRQHTIALENANARLQVQVQERELAEEEIRKLNAELEKRVRQRTAELEVAVNELETSSYTISHDLRAPLRAIHGYISILLEEDRYRLSSSSVLYLEKVRENALTMGTLVDSLLAFQRLNRIQLKKQTIDIETLARRTFAAMLSIENPERNIEFTCDALPPCQADTDLVRQALSALISNALKFTHSRVVARIHIGFTQIDGRVAYFIRDNGIGFDMRYSSKLFAIFQHLHSPSLRESGGTGVGLAFVQRIIAKHGGDIWAESEIDKGATFYFTIPNHAG